jgi:hypothetical protein
MRSPDAVGEGLEQRGLKSVFFRGGTVSTFVRRGVTALVVALVFGLAQPAVSVAPTAGVSAPHAAGTSSAAPAAAARAARESRRWKPRLGVLFNNPVGSGPAAHAINRKIMRAIDEAPKKSVIRVMSWNIMSRGGVNALLRAQARGVKIKVLMADVNTTLIDNPFWRDLAAGVRRQNQGRPEWRRSIAKLCIKSCRGTGGEAHGKYFLFSKTGRAENVFIQGSSNLTTAAAINQWNDIVTSTNPSQYEFAVDVFEEAVLDRPVANPWVAWTSPSGRTTTGFFPLRGAIRSDPVWQTLSGVTCAGATNTAIGRTRIRVAPDVMRHERGYAIASRLRDLWNQGCDVKIGYTVMGVSVYRLLRSPGPRGPVPMQHLVQDFNGDGEFDRYFHLKAMAIQGNVNGNTGAYVVVNGSGNWSATGAASDENFGVYWRKTFTKQYFRYIDYWFHNYPHSAPPGPNRSARLVTGPAALAARRGVPGAEELPIHTPDTLMTIDDQLVEGVDPYAQMEH